MKEYVDGRTEENEKSVHHPSLVIACYALFVFIGAPLIAPIIDCGIDWLRFNISFLQSVLVDVPFHRVVNRCLIALALIGLWPMLKALRVTNVRTLGWNLAPGIKKEIGIGILLGVLILIPLFIISLLVGIVRFENDFQSLARTTSVFGNAILSAVVVSILEETLFRGAILTALRRVHGVILAMIISSAIYAIMHFFAKPTNPEVVEWWSGFIVFGEMLRGFICWHQVIPGFLNLFAAGFLLAVLYQRTGRLWASVSVHAVWVFLLKVQCLFTHYNLGESVWFFGTSSLIDGWTAFLCLTIAIFLCIKYLPQCEKIPK